MCRSLVLLSSDMNQHADSHRLYCDQKEWHTLTQFPTESTREQSWQGCFTDTCIKGHPICPLRFQRSFTKIKRKVVMMSDVFDFETFYQKVCVANWQGRSHKLILLVVMQAIWDAAFLKKRKSISAASCFDYFLVSSPNLLKHNKKLPE